MKIKKKKKKVLKKTKTTTKVEGIPSKGGM